MIHGISIILYRYKYRIEKNDRYPALPARWYHKPCKISLGHIICHAKHGRSYSIPCQISPDQTTPYHIYHAMPTSKAIPYTVPYLARPYNILCHAQQTIPCQTPPDNNIYHTIPPQTNTYTIRCPPGHTIYHAMPARPHHIWHAR